MCLSNCLEAIQMSSVQFMRYGQRRGMMKLSLYSFHFLSTGDTFSRLWYIIPRLVHNRVMTDKLMYGMDLVQDPSFLHCIEIETIAHIICLVCSHNLTANVIIMATKEVIYRKRLGNKNPKYKHVKRIPYKQIIKEIFLIRSNL